MICGARKHKHAPQYSGCPQVCTKAPRFAATGLTRSSIRAGYRFTLLGRYLDEGEGNNARGCQGHGRDQHALATHSLNQEDGCEVAR